MRKRRKVNMTFENVLFNGIWAKMLESRLRGSKKDSRRRKTAFHGSQERKEARHLGCQAEWSPFPTQHSFF
jgi:hypothetical protein